MRSALVKVMIASTRVFTPVIAVSSIDLAPSMNGCALTINADRLAPIPGRPSVTPFVKPPTMFPKKEPSAKPIFSRIGMPAFKNSSSSGLRLISFPIAPTRTIMDSINVVITPMPARAGRANEPMTVRAAHTAVNTIAILIKAFAFASAFWIPSIAARTPTNAIRGTAIASRARAPR